MTYSDKERLDWLEKNASKIGIKPDWEYGPVDKYNRVLYVEEYTDIRKRIDTEMSKEEEL